MFENIGEQLNEMFADCLLYDWQETTEEIKHWPIREMQIVNSEHIAQNDQMCGAIMLGERLGYWTWLWCSLITPPRK